MKSFVVVFAVCIAGALAAGITDEQKAKLREYRDACVTETGVSEDAVNKLRAGEEVVFDEKLNCFSACILKKVGILKADGTIDEEVARSKVPKDIPQEKVDQVINSCKVQVGKDTCETGGKVLACLAKTKAVTLLQ